MEELLKLLRLHDNIALELLLAEEMANIAKTGEVRERKEEREVNVKAWSGSRYVIVKGYCLNKKLNYDADGNLVSVEMYVLTDRNVVKKLVKNLYYEGGHIVKVGEWEVVE